MITVFKRIRDLIRPTSSTEAGAQVLTIDLAIAGMGLWFFGACMAARGDLLWHLFSGFKVAGAFLCAFVLSLAPLFAIRRFFEVEAPFSALVSSFARYLALGGIFSASAAGCFALLARHDPAFDGLLAIGFVAVILLAVILVRRRSTANTLPLLPRVLAAILFVSLLAQSAWAFRPYMDPSGPTLFEAQAEWFGGEQRGMLERTIERLGEKL